MRYDTISALTRAHATEDLVFHRRQASRPVLESEPRVPSLESKLGVIAANTCCSGVLPDRTTGKLRSLYWAFSKLESLRSVGPSVSPAAARFYGGGYRHFSSCSRKNIGRAYCRNIKERRFVLSGTGKRLRRKRKQSFRVRGLQIAWLMCSIPPVQPGGQRGVMGLQRGAMNRFA